MKAALKEARERAAANKHKIVAANEAQTSITTFFKTYDPTKVVDAAALFFARNYLSPKTVISSEFYELCLSLRPDFAGISVSQMETARRKLSIEAKGSAHRTISEQEHFALMVDAATKQKTKVLVLLARFITPDFRVDIVPVDFLIPKEISLDGNTLAGHLSTSLESLPRWKQQVLVSHSDCGTELTACRLLQGAEPGSNFEVLSCTCHAIDLAIEAGLSIPELQHLVARKSGAMRTVIQKFAYSSGVIAWELAKQRKKVQSALALNMPGDTRWNSWAKPFLAMYQVWI